ncbi:MAG: MBL fold metallo-hydrolase [Armatimonadetes bacterium]|nr:MBL fold metallo-hydrolase [Armatimonadota bacterium]
MARFQDRLLWTSVGQGSLAIFWLGGASFVLKTSSQKVIYIDPYLSDSALILNRFPATAGSFQRMKEIPIQPEEAVADFVITTHDHLDHLDPDTIPGMAEAGPAKFIGPGTCCAHFRDLRIEEDRIVEVNQRETKQLDQDIRVTGVFARHVGPVDIGRLESDGALIFGPDDGTGYVLNLDGITVYHTSDTCYDDRLFDGKPLHPDVVLLAANGKGGNLTPEEGAALIAELQPSVVIPMHYGLIPETHSEPDELVSAIKRRGVASEVVVMEFGGEYVFRRASG